MIQYFEMVSEIYLVSRRHFSSFYRSLNINSGVSKFSFYKNEQCGLVVLMTCAGFDGVKLINYQASLLYP